MKSPAYPIYESNDELILEKSDRFKVEKKPEFSKKLTLEEVLEIPAFEPPIRPLHRFPRLVCENCGHHNQLHFDPIEDPGQLASVNCSKCKESAYFQFYWGQNEVGRLQDFIFFMRHAWLRELIKLGKQTFLNLKKLYGKH